MNRALATIALLILSNTFMTLAWYGHIAFKSKIERFGMLSIILLSWGIALFEYCFQVPANRIGSSQLGGPFSIWELKVIQEVISLLVFTVFAVVFMKSDTLRWNHLAGFVCLILTEFIEIYFRFRLRIIPEKQYLCTRKVRTWNHFSKPINRECRENRRQYLLL